MAIKMRVLYWTNKAKVKALANELKKEFDLALNSVDAIPPAYSCDKERLVVLCISIKDEPDDKLRLFCRELTKARAQNVALIIDGNEKGANFIKNILAEAGTNLISEVCYFKGGLPFLSKITDDEKKQVFDWAHRVVDQLA
ncbi:MAG: hypothetical protein SO125_05170 [Eubacteriales bacterium]|nr:hypothetical protein [Eubacteriales bacterium]MDY4898338.1 hypothetical protein [Eubacteriales bacterium]